MSVTAPDLATALTCETMKCENPDAKCCGGEPCVDITISVQHCGGCNMPCAARENCSNGSCTCTGGGHNGPCASSESCCSDGCHATMTDVTNCGGCGLACKMGETCNTGKCACGTGAGCSGSQICCGAGGCSDLTSDPKNCGKCGHACAPGKACNNSLCDGECPMCAMNETCCMDATGDGGVVALCANLHNDPMNCGKCGNVCKPFFGKPSCIIGICAGTPLDFGMPADLSSHD